MLRSVVDVVPALVLVLVLVVVGAVVGIVLLGVWAVRRWIPATRDGFDAEVSSQVLGVVASLFGLLLAFVIVIEFESFNAASDNVQTEADDLSTIVRDSYAFDGPGGAHIRSAIGSYVRVVIDKEWPLMRHGDGVPPPGSRLTEYSEPCRPTVRVLRRFSSAPELCARGAQQPTQRK